MALAYPQPPLRSALVGLRPWEHGDVQVVRAAGEDAYVAELEHIPRPCSEREAAAWIDRQRSAAEEGAGLSLLVAGAEGPAGGIGFRFRFAGVAGLGHWLLPQARRRGLAREATILLSRWLLTEAPVHRVEATAEPWNEPSQRVFEAAGFVREGLLRRYAYGRDAYVYSLVADDL